MNNNFEITIEMVNWIDNHRHHRYVNNPHHLQQMTLNELHDGFRNTFPNSKDSLDFGTARYLDEQLCGVNNCGNYWRQAYGFPGEVGTVSFCNFMNTHIRVISTGIFTFNFEIVENAYEN